MVSLVSGLSVREILGHLADAHKCVVTAVPPRLGFADLARIILSGLRSPEHGADPHGNWVELRCVCLTVVARMVSGLTSRCPVVASLCRETLRTLFEELNVLPLLVLQFQSPDQMLSHIAAKCTVAYVYHHLQASGFPPAWQDMCLQAFVQLPPCTQLDACIWSLTAVLKRLLKEERPGLVEKLLLVFDSSLNVLCSRFLPPEKQVSPQTRGQLWGSTLFLLLDLMEVLMASAVCLRRQSLMHCHLAALLTSTHCCAPYFVQKRVLLLLKRAALQTAGEDWLPGGAVSAGREHSGSELSTLARGILGKVAAGWLDRILVRTASSLGGSSNVGGGKDGKPDGVMLRAVSLLLLKSIEIHVCTDDKSGIPATTAHLQTLWSFVRRSGVHPEAEHHTCCLFAPVFGGQDDDMMEAAKTLLAIFLILREYSGKEDCTVLEWACASGCNPHCHFLLLLHSVSFDQSLLLDFLISMETCFLEYLIRYLKLLRTDRKGFTDACGRMNGMRPLSRRGSRSGPGSVLMWSSACVAPPDTSSPEGRLNPTPKLRLVEYDSSEESESEDTEADGFPKPGPDPELGWGQEFGINRDPDLTSPGSLSEPRPSVHRLEPLGNSDRTHLVSCRAMECLSALRGLVTRLWKRKLFPYNPSSLLKLLAEVEDQ